MYSVYFIKSQKNSRIYVGNSQNSQKRIRQHNKGKTKTTKQDRPWILIYEEKYTTRSLAQRREKYLKSLYGYKTRKKIINRVLRKK